LLNFWEELVHIIPSEWLSNYIVITTKVKRLEVITM